MAKPGDLTIREIIHDYYKENGFDADGGESKSYVKVELFKGLSFYLPNNETRKKVILFHDVHHLLTGYSTKFKGEIEISTWELSTGCTGNWVAFTLNTYAMALGVLLNFKGMWLAWKRGRNTTNLYQTTYHKEQLLDMGRGHLKNELGLCGEQQYRHSLTTRLSFIGFLFFSIIFSTLSLVLVPFVLIYSLIIATKIND